MADRPPNRRFSAPLSSTTHAGDLAEMAHGTGQDAEGETQRATEVDLYVSQKRLDNQKTTNWNQNWEKNLKKHKDGSRNHTESQGTNLRSPAR